MNQMMQLIVKIYNGTFFAALTTLYNYNKEIPIAKALRHQIEVQKRLDEQLELIGMQKPNDLSNGKVEQL
ncbi:unnamed protein product [Lupinus luteus]|uniref:MYB-CC type transcription factor LHEQLE-containing domain-containing protein n=1 Tax=Lupinus luteus TaxID=3873 RepID=A0AAV1YBA5_LUPLU